MEDVVSSSPSPGMLLCPTQRLIVVKMVLHHFKSYGHVESLGPFHKRFTAVVGPNGSGKSSKLERAIGRDWGGGARGVDWRGPEK